MAFADRDAAEMSELLMLGLGKTGRARAPAEAASARDSYHYYALTLYRQALLAPDDSAREDDARYHLAESVFRRCYKLVASPAQQDRRPGLWAGIRASAVLRIRQRDMAVRLRTVMPSLTTSSAAAVKDGDQAGGAAAGRQ